MGRPSITEFTVQIEYDDNGAITGMVYYDADGCGHESQVFDTVGPMVILANYHLDHLRHSHRIERERRCPKTWAMRDGSERRCIVKMPMDATIHEGSCYVEPEGTS